MWFNVSVNNTPDYAEKHIFTVAVPVDCELWFHGSYDDIKTAKQVAKEVGGLVLVNGNISKWKID